MLNANNLSEKLSDFLADLAKKTTNYYTNQFTGCCGAVEIYNLKKEASNKQQLIHALYGITEDGCNHPEEWYGVVIFSDILDEKTRYSYLKRISKKSQIVINPKTNNKIQIYTLDLAAILKGLKINPKDKKWKD